MALVTWDNANKSATATLSNGDLTAKASAGSDSVRASLGKRTGKWYWEIKVDTLGAGMIGISNNLSPLNAVSYNTSYVKYYYNAGTKYAGALTYGASYSAGNTISVLLDLNVGTIEFWKNGVSQGIAFTDVLSLGEVFPTIASGGSTGITATANFGATPFIYEIPKGYKSYDGNQGEVIKILIQSSYGEVERVNSETFKVTSIQLPIAERDYLNRGIDSLLSINPKTLFNKKVYILKNSTPLNSGKTFEQQIDTQKYKVKKITFE